MGWVSQSLDSQLSARSLRHSQFNLTGKKIIALFLLSSQLYCDTDKEVDPHPNPNIFDRQSEFGEDQDVAQDGQILTRGVIPGKLVFLEMLKVTVSNYQVV